MNWGGGHLLTDENYNIKHLIQLINRWQDKYGLKIILEPGEAIGHDMWVLRNESVRHY